MKTPAYSNRSLQRFLEITGMKRRQFAQMIGTTYNSVENWLTRRKKPLPPDQAWLIDRAFGVKGEDLLAGKGKLRINDLHRAVLMMSRSPRDNSDYTSDDFELWASPYGNKAEAGVVVRAQVMVERLLLCLLAAARAERSHKGRLNAVSARLDLAVAQILKQFRLGHWVKEVLEDPDWKADEVGVEAKIGRKVAEMFEGKPRYLSDLLAEFYSLKGRRGNQRS